MTKKNNGLLRLIAIFKLIKAVSLIALGMGALHLVHDDNPVATLIPLLEKVGFNPGGHLLDQLLGKIANLPAKDFLDLGVGSFIYAGLFLTEGLGLWLEKPWAEWFTTIITASLLPVEIYELVHRPTAGKVVVLLLNVAIVVYLVVRIRQERGERS